MQIIARKLQFCIIECAFVSLQLEALLWEPSKLLDLADNTRFVHRRPFKSTRVAAPKANFFRAMKSDKIPNLQTNDRNLLIIRSHWKPPFWWSSKNRFRSWGYWMWAFSPSTSSHHVLGYEFQNNRKLSKFIRLISICTGRKIVNCQVSENLRPNYGINLNMLHMASPSQIRKHKNPKSRPNEWERG